MDPCTRSALLSHFPLVDTPWAFHAPPAGASCSSVSLHGLQLLRGVDRMVCLHCPLQASRSPRRGRVPAPPQQTTRMVAPPP
jgi:hypothetical protein